MVDLRWKGAVINNDRSLLALCPNLAFLLFPSLFNAFLKFNVVIACPKFILIAWSCIATMLQYLTVLPH